MHRRQYLALVGTAGLAGAGQIYTVRPKSADGERFDSEQESGSAEEEPEFTTESLDLEDENLPVPKEELTRAAPKDAIPAIIDPAYGEDWQDTTEVEFDRQLFEDDKILGVEFGGRARAYPIKLLNRHEIVNDHLGDPLLVTYCPVCRSGVVADRRIDGQAETFGVSGYLYQANLVAYDQRTESLWSQLRGTAIRGPLTGTDLEIRQSSITTWESWREEYPGTEVLLPPPDSNTVAGEVSFNYDISLHERRRELAKQSSDISPLGELEVTDTRLTPRSLVIGIETEQETKAYPYAQAQYGPINDTVGELPIVVTSTGDNSLYAYDRRVDGERIEFELVEGDLVGGGSRWNRLTGTAEDGPFQGTVLSPAPAIGPLYWVAWIHFYPDSALHGHEE